MRNRGIGRLRAGGGVSLASAMAALFANGETGMGVHEISPFNTFSDTGGTTPATVNGSVAAVRKTAGTVSLVTQATGVNKPTLRGTPLGVNITAADGNFATPGNWTPGAGWVIGSARGTATTASAALTLNTVSAIAAKLYLVRYYVTQSAGSITVNFGGTAGVTRSAFGFYEEYILATSTAGLSFTTSGFTGTVSQIMIWDADAASVGAPYFLWCDGNNSLTAAYSLSAYPLTLFAYDRLSQGSTDASSISVSQADGFQKRMLSGNGGEDRNGASTISFGGGAGGTQLDVVQIDQFDTSLLSARTELQPGTPVVNTNAFGAAVSLFIGKGYSASSFHFGRIYAFLAINRLLTTAEQSTLEYALNADGGCQCWGDSLTAGSGVISTTFAYPFRLMNLTARQTYNNGTPSDTSTQILTRFNADTTEKDKIVNIFWAGTNDDWAGAGSTAPTMANVAAMIGGLKGRGRFLVLSLTYLTTTGLTPPALTYLASINSQWAALYGNRFVDIRTMLQANGDGSGTDNADIAAGNIPTSLRSDSIHLNDKGYQLVAKMVADRMVALGWARIG